MAKDKKDCPPVGAPLWMATFGDLMSLLLTFFILLVSFSSMQQAKFEQAIGSVKGALGVLSSLPTVSIHREVVVPQGESITNVDDMGEHLKVEESVESLEEKMELLDKRDVVNVSRTKRGLAIRLEGNLLFAPGEVSVQAAAYPILDEVCETLKGFPNDVRVEGHTDNVPMSSNAFASNWELSAARAGAIVRFFQERGMEPSRMMAVGLGEWQPVARNDTVEGRQKNRRVEIFMDIPTDSRGPRLGEHY
ncbi:MAG: OmpA family protein [bacterium]|nr:OmpA family protein [bacterium]